MKCKKKREEEQKSFPQPNIPHAQSGQGREMWGKEAAKAERISISAMFHPSACDYNDFCSSSPPDLALFAEEVVNPEKGRGSLFKLILLAG